jgi:hypothetical protein
VILDLLKALDEMGFPVGCMFRSPEEFASVADLAFCKEMKVCSP